MDADETHAEIHGRRCECSDCAHPEHCPCDECDDVRAERLADPRCCYECGADPSSPAPDGVTYAADGTPLCGECERPLLGAARALYLKAVQP